MMPLLQQGSAREIMFAVLMLIVCCPDAFPQPGSVRFAVIGDYGFAGQPELEVANLVRSWNPDFVITTGDNNYPNGASSTIDQNIGQYYHNFIFPYTGAYGQGDTINRFFPSLGNHDWVTPGATAYLDYFGLPGNERYYDFVRGPVHFFAIDSDVNEPDGNSSASAQANWLQAQLAASSAPWKLVYFHHPSFSSGTTHGSTTVMQWPFKLWGATLVLSGHEHLYERLLIDSLPYVVNGLGGRSLYPLGPPVSGSIVQYNADYGAMLVEADVDSIWLRFITRAGVTIDSYTIVAMATSVYEVDNRITEEYSLSQNYPNPFNPATVITFVLPGPAYVELKIFDLLGREVAELVGENKEKGVHEIKVDTDELANRFGREMASGVYLYRLKTRPIDAGQGWSFLQTKKMLLLK